MTDKERTNVLAAYELLLEQLEAEMADINRQGSAAFARGDYEEAGQLLSQVGELGQLRGQVQALEPSLRRLIKPRAVTVPAAVIKPPHPQPVAGQAPAGPLTPNEAYILPILRALVAAGGSARASAVTASVYAEMAPRLTERDWAPRKSSPKCPAWENNIHWCRNKLREKGLLKSGSPHGVWEISEAGREYLAAPTGS